MGAEMSRKGRQSRGPCLELPEAGALRLPWEQEREMVRVGEKASRQFQPQDGTRPGDRSEVLLGWGLIPGGHFSMPGTVQSSSYIS